MNSLDVAAIKADFPIFQKMMRNDARLVYLDSGATSQKPVQVLDAERFFYTHHNAAAHRGSHLLAEEASTAYEGARTTVATFIGADSDEVIFTKSATESINLIAYSFSNTQVAPFALTIGDEILVSEMEHHANLIPWQQLAKRTGAVIRWFSVTADGRFDLSNIDQLINERTKIVAITHQSNVLGTIPPVALITSKAHAVGAIVVLDACQSAPHFPMNVVELDVDFVAFSGHKMLGPTGIGVLWGRAALLAKMEPFLFGGSMIETVTMESATWAPAPRKFEAGVPNMAQAVGLAAAIDYLTNIGMAKIHQHETELTQYTLDTLQTIKGLNIFGPLETIDRGGVISFALEGIHPHDAGQVLDQYGVAVRTGHHCAWPLMRKYGVAGTTRASLYLYNDRSDIDALAEAITATQKYFKVS
jgi:cysteine desulfurase/selenocysteine lyase